MKYNTLVLIAVLTSALAYVGSARSEEAKDDKRDQQAQRSRVTQDGTTLTISTDILVNRLFTDEDAATVREAATAAGQDADQAVARARRAQFDERCKLWMTYLAQQNGRSEQVKFTKDSINCEEATRSGSDGRTRNGTLTVEAQVPADRKVVERRRTDFKSTERYQSWVECHRAASRVRNAVVAICDEGRTAGDQYVTTLRVFEFQAQ